MVKPLAAEPIVTLADYTKAFKVAVSPIFDYFEGNCIASNLLAGDEVNMSSISAVLNAVYHLEEPEIFTDAEQYKSVVEGKAALMDRIEHYLFTCPFSTELTQVFRQMVEASIASVSNIDDGVPKLNSLLAYPGFASELDSALNKLERWEILDALSIMPEGFINYEKGCDFLKAVTKTEVRNAFKYTHAKVPQLETLGFRMATVAKEIKFIKDFRTGVLYIYRGDNANCSVIKDLASKRRNSKSTVAFTITYNEVIGIDISIHSAAVKEYNEQAKIRFADAHRVKHKPHKQHKEHKPHKTHAPHKPHKEHTRPNRKPKKLINHAGELLTAKQYSEAMNISLAQAYREIAANGEDCC